MEVITLGMAWPGVAWLGLARRGKAGRGRAGRGKAFFDSKVNNVKKQGDGFKIIEEFNHASLARLIESKAFGFYFGIVIAVWGFVVPQTMLNSFWLGFGVSYFFLGPSFYRKHIMED